MNPPKPRILVIIPARGGSKSIPKKNIKMLGGKPLIAYPIELAKSVPEIDRVVVSTDSEEIAAVARTYGAEVPFLRPAELAEDQTPTLPVLQHCVKFLEEREGYKPDIIIHLFATNPFLKKETVQEAIRVLIREQCGTVISVEEDYGRFWQLDESSGQQRPFHPKERVNRQYYQPLLRENGAIYFSTYDVIMNQNKAVDDQNAKFIIMKPGELIDIDTPEDWNKAEERIKWLRSRERTMLPLASEIKIGNKIIGENQPCFIIAELSANHNQDFELAVQTIKAAKEAGADAIKIQTYTADTITIDCDNEHFQIKQGGAWDGQTLHQLYQKAYTPWEWQPRLQKIAAELGLIFFSAPFDNTAVDFLEQMNVPAYKIASYEINDIPFIEYIAAKGKPIFISTGTATAAEIAEALEACQRKGNNQVILLKCVSGYPTPLEEVNLKLIPDFAERFGTIVGLSDHTIEMSVPVAAVALGAKVVERHLILDRKLGGPDAHFSTDINEFKAIVKAIREAEKSLGQVTYELTAKMDKERVFRRSLFFVTDVKAGETITAQQVRSIRPAAGLPTKHITEVLGKVAVRNIKKGTPVSWELIR